MLRSLDSGDNNDDNYNHNYYHSYYYWYSGRYSNDNNYSSTAELTRLSYNEIYIAISGTRQYLHKGSIVVVVDGGIEGSV